MIRSTIKFACILFLFQNCDIDPCDELVYNVRPPVVEFEIVYEDTGKNIFFGDEFDKTAVCVNFDTGEAIALQFLGENQHIISFVPLRIENENYFYSESNKVYVKLSAFKIIELTFNVYEQLDECSSYYSIDNLAISNENSDFNGQYGILRIKI